MAECVAPCWLLELTAESQNIGDCTAVSEVSFSIRTSLLEVWLDCGEGATCGAD